MAAYYNEFDPRAAEILRELMKEGAIAPGDVDTRSIEDVCYDDIKAYTQCHFFAGVGIWSLACTWAGWPDERPIWTGSCPCQPFSAAGKGKGFADERHLWPAFFHLIGVGRPDIVAGEQVASKDGLAWLDLVQTDLENEGYAVGAIDTCAAGFGAPHIRQRLYWVGITPGGGCEWLRNQPEHGQFVQADQSDVGRLDYAPGPRHLRPQQGTERNPRDETRLCVLSEGCGLSGLANANGGNTSNGDLQRGWQHGQQPQDGGSFSGLALTNERQRGPGRPGPEPASGSYAEPAGRSVISRRGPGPTNGLWRAADWIGCRDEKWRPVEPGTFPLADAGTFRNRVATLRGAGNALNLAQAAAVIESLMEREL